MDLFQLLIDRGSQHYRNESGHDPEDIFSEDRAADLLCDKLFCQHAVQLYCHFCGTACHRLWLQFYGMPVFTFDYGHRVYFALGLALITSACTVYLRDLEHILGIVSMAWMYMSPVVYPLSFIPKKLQSIFQLNPMAPIITAYRDILYYKQIPQLQTLLMATVTGIIFVGVGCFVFERLQRGFVEEL